MTWTRISDGYFDREESLELSRSALLLDIEAMVFCNRMLKDGKLPKSALRRITTSEDLDSDVAELLKVGIWTDEGDHYQVDWSDQKTAAEVLEERQGHRDRQKRYERRRKLHSRGDHRECHPRYCSNASSNASPDASPDASGDASMTASLTPARPDPSRPVPSRPPGRDRDRDQASPSAPSAGAPGAGRGRQGQAASVVTFEPPVTMPNPHFNVIDLDKNEEDELA